jgi:phage tail-like protein
MMLCGQAVGPRSVVVTFDQPITFADPQDFALIALDKPAVPVRVIEATADGATVALTLDTTMSPDVRYRLTAPDIARRGNKAEPPILVQTEVVGFCPARPAERSFDLWSMLPKHNRRDDNTHDLQRFIACLQEPLDLLFAKIDRQPDLFDIERAPERFVDAILTDLGNPFQFNLDSLGKRRLAAVLAEMYRQKATVAGIRNAIRFFLGIEVLAITPFIGQTLILGESALDLDWELGPSDRFARYAFDVQVGVVLTANERNQLREMVNFLRPAHTHFVNLIEPTGPALLAHWELGLSAFGDETTLH